MTAKFEAFKAALDALCKEHGIRLADGCDDDCEYAEVHAEYSDDESMTGLFVDIREIIQPTPEEIAAEEARRAAEQAEWNAKWADKWDGSYMKHHFALLDAMSLAEKQAMIAANAEEQRKKHMRVTRIPGDHNDIGERPCRVYCNEQEIEGWTVADDFRRVVETPGKVHHGAVRIDLDGHKVEVPVEMPAEVPSNSLSGMFVPAPKPAAPPVEAAEATPEPAPAPAPTFAAPAVKPAPKHIPARKRKAGK